MIDQASHSSRRAFLLGSAAAATFTLAPALSAFAAVIPTFATRRDQSFDLGWRFYKGNGSGFETVEFDDATWHHIDLPHDWSIENLPPASLSDPNAKPSLIGPFNKKALNGVATGFAEGGTGWYRKRFRVAMPKDGQVEIVFDGVYMNSEVWINGHLLGVHQNGYTEFAYDLTPYLRMDADNVLAVRVKNEGKNSRWYSGSGIYRHVSLSIFPERVRVGRYGTSVVTRRITDNEAQLDIGTSLQGLIDGVTVSSLIKDAKGRTVWAYTGQASTQDTHSVSLKGASVWSAEAPNLYTLETTLMRGRKVIDRTTTEFGVRIIAFNAQTGMTINGKPTKLRGGCIHHDHGLIGAASFDGAEERKVRLLKARGFNAVRPSHNPFSQAFLNACDRLGMLVVAETFDAWQSPKVPDDYSVVFADQWKSDLSTIIRGQRNHPSIIMWSIGNEIPDRNTPAGLKNQWLLAQAAHELDPYRPVTAAVNDFAGRELIASEATARPGRANEPDQASFIFLDVAGYNYKYGTYVSDHSRYPNRPIYGSESFPKDVFAIWDLTDKSPFLIGDFVWTAMDYLGEAGIGGSVYVGAKFAAYGATPGAWPMINAFCGDIDLIGNQKTQSLARDVAWGVSPLEVAVQKPVPTGKVEILRPWGWSDERSSWTWPGAEGQSLVVRVFTSGDRVELVLNGTTIATRVMTAADLKQSEFVVPYRSGTLEVITYADMKVLSRKTLATAGAPAKISVKPDQRTGRSGRGQLIFVQVEVQDLDGRHAGDVAVDLNARVSGPAELIGFGSGNPNAVRGFQSAVSQTHNSQALLILRSTGKPGTVGVIVTGEGLDAGQTSIKLS